MTAAEDFQTLRTSEGQIDAQQLDEVWAQLEPVHIDELTSGRWHGFGFDTGHRMGKRLVKSRWYGKNFTSALDAQPLICRSEDGELFSDLESGRGEASLWMVEFRGESTATMVYDGMPVFDHFKKVDDDTIMGIMNGKAMVLDQGQHYYFGLERDLTE